MVRITSVTSLRPDRLKHLFSCPTLAAAAVAAKSLQSCPTLCNPIDGLLPGFPIPGILQARTLEWVAISFSNAWKQKVKVKSLSCVQLLATSWTEAYQAPPSMRFSRQECWSGVPLPSPQHWLEEDSCIFQSHNSYSPILPRIWDFLLVRIPQGLSVHTCKMVSSPDGKLTSRYMLIITQELYFSNSPVTWRYSKESRYRRWRKY